MKYIVTGSLGNISLPVTKNLLAAGHDVTVISHSEDKKAQIEALGAHAAIGSAEDAAFVKSAFQNADIAYLMIPSSFALTDYEGFQLKVADAFLDALKDSQIKHVVVLSSLGAHLREGAGPIDALGYLEEKLFQIPNLHVSVLRPSYFFSNLFSLGSMIQHAGIAGNNFGDTDEKLVLTHTDHIAEIATDKLLNPTEGKTITNIANDERHPSEIAAVLGKALGKENIPWITFSDEDAYQGMLGAGLNESFASLYKEMGQALHSGKMQEAYWQDRPAQLGSYKLEDFAKEFAGAFGQA